MRNPVSSGHFEKKLKKFVSTHPELRTRVIAIINTLLLDPLTRKYKAHKLSAPLRGCYGVSISFGYRIVYTFDTDSLYLLNIGSHDEVY